MAHERLTLRRARHDDLADLVNLEAACWPTPLAAKHGQLSARIATFHRGQLVAQIGEQLVGYSSAQRIHAELITNDPLQYNTVTDNDRFTTTHANDGEIYQLVGVSTAPEFRGRRIARQLIDLQIARAWKLDGVRRVMGFTRPAARHLTPELSLESYVAIQLTAHGSDKTLAFHLNAGARIVSCHDNFRPSDQQSLGAGVLIEYSR